LGLTSLPPMKIMIPKETLVKKIAFVLLLVLLAPISTLAKTTKTASAPGNDKYGLPSNETLIDKGTYIVSYNDDYKIPNWVAYHLSRSDVQSTLSRSGHWTTETKVPVEFRATSKDYSNSGYDKGHLCPSADMARSLKTMQTTFCYSNCAPQVGVGFNRGIWKDLEDQVRKWVAIKGDLWIYIGVYFNSDDPEGKPEFDPKVNYIGDHVGIPPHWYKIIYSPSDGSLIAFEFDNKAYPGHDFRSHQVTVRQIEDETGLDFLNKLPKATQDKIETKKETGTWN